MFSSNRSSILVVGILLIFIVACNSVFTPKPNGYFDIGFPKKKYQVFSQAGYPYEFEYPVYAQIVKDSSFFWRSHREPMVGQYQFS